MAVLPAQSLLGQTEDPEVSALKRKLEAAQLRFARLVSVLGEHVDSRARKGIFESLGRECAKQYRGLTAKYANDIKGFLAAAQQQWVESVEYDEASGTIRIVDKATTCSCPLVNQSLTPPEFCDCTLGWQKETYSMILGRPVEAEIEESLLRGGKRCVFQIRVV
jgi:predicted hydrocarbon binding protein